MLPSWSTNVLYPEKKQVKHKPNLQSAILNQLLPVTGDDVHGDLPVVFTIP